MATDTENIDELAARVQQLENKIRLLKRHEAVERELENMKAVLHRDYPQI